MLHASTLVIVLAAAIVVEACAIAAAGLLGWLGEPIASRAGFLAEQTRVLNRLVSAPAAREQLHPVLGWQYRPGLDIPSDQINSQTLRALRDYGPRAPAGVTRIAAYGDSFVYCNEVSNAEAWPAQIEAGWRAEVLNAGVGGYGPDQGLIRYRAEQERFSPDVVLIGFTTVMATRVVSRYSRFLDHRDGPWFKPRFLLNGSGLELVPSPVASREDVERLKAEPRLVTGFGEHDFWYNRALFESPWYPLSATYRLVASFGFRVQRRFLSRDRMERGGQLNSEAESFRILLRIFEEFAAIATAKGARPVVLMLPARSQLDPVAFDRLIQPLRAELTARGIKVIDVVEAVAAGGTREELFVEQFGHYTAKANAIVARTVAEALGLQART